MDVGASGVEHVHEPESEPPAVERGPVVHRFKYLRPCHAVTHFPIVRRNASQRWAAVASVALEYPYSESAPLTTLQRHAK